MEAIEGSGPPPAEAEGQRLQVIPHEGWFLVLGWYKRRGSVEVAQVVDGHEVRPLTLADAEEVLAVLTRGPLVEPDAERYRPELVAAGEFAMPESQDAADVVEVEHGCTHARVDPSNPCPVCPPGTRFAEALEVDAEPRPAGCRCHLEVGDSPCPVHGEEES